MPSKANSYSAATHERAWLHSMTSAKGCTSPSDNAPGRNQQPVPKERDSAAMTDEQQQQSYASACLKSSSHLLAEDVYAPSQAGTGKRQQQWETLTWMMMAFLP